LYVFGGDRGTTVAEAAVYDPALNSWSELPPMPTPRNHLAAAVLRGRIYVVGGRPGNIAVNEAFDPLRNTWTAKAPMPTARSGIAAAAAGNFLFAFGGEGNRTSPAGIFPQNEAYDVDLDVWTMLAPMAQPRHGIGAAVIGNRIFIPGGSPVEGFGTTAQSDFFAVNEDLLLPQFVVGGGYSTSIVIANPSASQPADVTVTLADVNGAPLETNLDGTLQSAIALAQPSPLRSGQVAMSQPMSTSGTSAFSFTSAALHSLFAPPQSRAILFRILCAAALILSSCGVSGQSVGLAGTPLLTERCLHPFRIAAFTLANVADALLIVR